MEINSVKDLQKKFENINKKRFYRMVLLLDYSLYKKDGSKTKFAENFKIETFDDLYQFFKNIKEELKNDHEDKAFFNIAEFCKSVIGRLSNFLYVTFQMDNKYFAQFVATIFTIRTIGFILDNLNELKQVFKELTALKEKDVNISGEVEDSQQIKLEKEDENNSEDVKEKIKNKLNISDIIKY